MKIIRIKPIPIRIPLRVQFSQASNTTRHSSSLILELTTASGVRGYGECCPRTYVTGEDLSSVLRDIETISELLMIRRFDTLAAIQQLVVEILPGKIGPAAICAVELALLDAWGKVHGQNLISLLGNQQKQHLEYSLVLPLLPPAKLATLLERYSFLNAREIKLKIDRNLPQTLENIRLIRKMFSYPLNIRVDANCGWSFKDALEHIPALMESGVQCFEQIFPAGMEECMGLITDRFGDRAYIMADESLTSYRSAQNLIENRYCNRLNIKISKLGGMFNSLKVYQLAVANGIGCQLGAHYGETSILTAAGILFSAMAPNVHVHEGGLGTWLLREDICRESLMFDHQCQIKSACLQGPGIGPCILPDKLQQFMR